MENLLNELNDMQFNAVKNTEGPQLILAGAGSGKTKVLTSKIAYVIKEKNVNPKEILAFTFTNKAAAEMKERVANLLDADVDWMWIGTFHSICVRILRRNMNLTGYTSSFSIYDMTDQKTLIRECLKELNLDEKIFSPNYVQNRISGLKNEGVSPEEFEKFAFSLPDKNLLDIYKLYESKMKTNNAFDFDDLIIKTIELLSTDEQVRLYYQSRFRYVFVDEYQDTNNIQYELIKLLTGYHMNLCVVGDADQSIYKWRGANINNIINFEKDYLNTNRVILSQNYRSTGSILEAANKVIANNKNRIKKDLWTAKGEGKKPLLYELTNDLEESLFVVNKIKELLNSGETPSDIAILYRSNALSRNFEEQLIKNNINYKVIGGIKFYDRAEIKDLMAYLRLIVNPDDDVSFRRIINSPKRGIGDVTVDKLNQISLDRGISLFKSIDFIDHYDLFDARATKNLEEFKKLIDNLVLKSESISISELLEFLLDRVEYITILEKENTIESKSKIENIEEFLNSIKVFEENDGGTLHEYLTGVSLMSDVDKTEDVNNAISLLTVHSAKGLEFKYVFIVALEENIFPSAFTEDEDDLEEERRLMYVAITRAKEELYLSHATSRMRYGKINRQLPSTFIKELEDSVEKIENKSSNRVLFKPKEYTAVNTVFKQPNKNFNNLKNVYNSDSITKESFKTGQKVKHKKWGLGMITEIKPSDGDNLITILFDDGSLKTLIESLAPLEVYNE